ncbi:MAG: NapC/NirT family cytochrome c [Calditrichia bacterium]
MKVKLPRSVQNWVSLIGATIALISLFMIIFLLVITIFFVSERSSYIGLVTYILLPAVMVVGLILIPLGMYLNSRREQKRGYQTKPGWPRIDLNVDSHRNAFFIFAIGTTIFLFLSAVGSYEAFHYTESTEFCGTLCHSVMHPEYIAYQNSPHAQVACVACHVGPGADWYVRSKLSGLYQVYAVTTNVYPKPIPTPIENLRPAREVCEQCHWPQKFYARKMRLETHYLSDEENTRWDIRLVMKIGAEHASLGLKEGIHWHINSDVKVEYAATDDQREEIAWVRYTNLQTGEVKVFEDEYNTLEEGQLDTMEVRTMDCIDCHNRPSHLYRPPSQFLNSAMVGNQIPPDLPEIKSVAVELCDREYASMDSALEVIRQEITTYYQDNYEDLVSEQPEKLEQAIVGVQNAFSTNIFPNMNVRWSEYPNHIGHMEYRGCFRCHNNTHQSSDGETISMECNLCHTIIGQGTPGEMQMADLDNPLEFKHPVDIGEAWKEGICVDCHTGLNP